jgi:hypothetical protein
LLFYSSVHFSCKIGRKSRLNIATRNNPHGWNAPPRSSAPRRARCTSPYPDAEAGPRPLVRAPHPSGRASLPRGAPTLAARTSPLFSPSIRRRPPVTRACQASPPYLRCKCRGRLRREASPPAHCACLFKAHAPSSCVRPRPPPPMPLRHLQRSRRRRNP